MFLKSLFVASPLVEFQSDPHLFFVSESVWPIFISNACKSGNTHKKIFKIYLIWTCSFPKYKYKQTGYVRLNWEQCRTPGLGYLKYMHAGLEPPAGVRHDYTGGGGGCYQKISF